MNGYQIAGTSLNRKRVDNDFYATPEKATEALMAAEKFDGAIWECACGDGAMVKVLLKYNPVVATDLVNRGYGNGEVDFLTTNQIVENVVTNPPFNLFQEFAEHALKIAQKKVALFGKLQALEGQRRATFMQNSPLKTVYVFKKRVNPLRNGSAVDEKGNPWSSTMAFAWFVWEIDYQGKPQICWI